MKFVQQGFTLIGLMIVVAIIGILAAVAIPSYQDYTARAQVAEAMTLTSSLKTGMAEWYGDYGSFPAAIASVTSSVSGKYVSVIAFANSAGGTINVNATMKTKGVNAAISGLVFSMGSTSGGANWSCGSQTGLQAAVTTSILDKHLPSACK